MNSTLMRLSSSLARLKQRAFTLVELLIVVIILAILAAIIVPQFTSATVDAQEAALDSNLTALRTAIELYNAQHLGAYPGTVATGGSTCPAGGVAGVALANTPEAFIEAMTMYSYTNGKTCSLGDKVFFKYGPYMRKGIPADPITGKGAIAAEIVVTTAGTALAPAAATGGWAYDNRSGQIVMNSNALDSKNKAYSTH